VAGHRPSWSQDELVARLSKYSYKDGDLIVRRSYSDLLITIVNNEVKITFLDDNSSIADFDIVLLYSPDQRWAPIRHVVAAYLHKKGVAIVNSESLKFQVMTKLEQNVVLALNDIPVPDSVYTTDRDNYSAAISSSGFNYPLIVKAIGGDNGNDNEIIYSAKELSELSFDNSIIQPFIPNDFDYRVIVADDEVIFAYKRVREKGHKNNISQGGAREFIELPSTLKKLAVKAAHITGREFCGLDILTNKTNNQSVVLEVNFSFGTPRFDDKKTEREFYDKMLQYFRSLNQ
jgi:RimK family alpha-L-glutamate ligase